MRALPIGGTCKTCGLDLVQTSDRTYHPVVLMWRFGTCPDLLPMPDAAGLSLNVPPENFIAATT